MSASHIFICFSSKDEAKALHVVDHLEQHGFKCWISSRDVRPGQNYQELIVRAIETAAGLVFLFSEFSNATGEVKKELSLASSFDVPVVPLRMSATMPNGALMYELATRQWIDAFPELDSALERLVGAVQEIMAHRHAHHAGAHPGANIGADKPFRPQPAARPVPRAPLLSPSSEEFDSIRSLLARHVGPIAKVLVQKAAADSQSLDEFCGKLADHVRAPAERAAFLKAARQRLSVRS